MGSAARTAPQAAWFTGVPQLAYVFVMRIASAILANVLIWSQTPFYPSYVESAERHGIAPMTDQNLSGAVLMIEGSLVTILVFAWLFLRWARNEELRQELRDRAARDGLTLDPTRIDRAVAAGHGDALRKRLDERVAAGPDATRRP